MLESKYIRSCSDLMLNISLSVGQSSVIFPLLMTDLQPVTCMCYATNQCESEFISQTLIVPIPGHILKLMIIKMYMVSRGIWVKYDRLHIELMDSETPD